MKSSVFIEQTTKPFFDEQSYQGIITDGVFRIGMCGVVNGKTIIVTQIQPWKTKEETGSAKKISFKIKSSKQIFPDDLLEKTIVFFDANESNKIPSTQLYTLANNNSHLELKEEHPKIFKMIKFFALIILFTVIAPIDPAIEIIVILIIGISFWTDFIKKKRHCQQV